MLKRIFLEKVVDLGDDRLRVRVEVESTEGETEEMLRGDAQRQLREMISEMAISQALDTSELKRFF